MTKKLFSKILFIVAVVWAMQPLAVLAFDDDAFDYYGYGSNGDGRLGASTLQYESLDEAVAAAVRPHQRAYRSFERALKDWTKSNKEQGHFSQLQHKVVLIAGEEEAKQLATELKKNADTAFMNVFGKDYNGISGKDAQGKPKLFYATGSLQEPRAIFLKNYEIYGDQFALHFPQNPANSMGFISNEQEVTQINMLRAYKTAAVRDLDSKQLPAFCNLRLWDGLCDLMLFAGKDGKGEKGLNFCYSNTLASEAATLGAAQAINMMVLRATTDLQVLQKRSSTIKQFVRLFEDPKHAAFLERNLQMLMKFEDDFLQIINSEGLRRSVLGDAKRYFFAASELLGISRLSQEGKQMDRIGAQLKNSKDDNVSVAMRAFGSGIGVAGRAIKTAMQKLERFFDEQETLLTLGVPYTILKEIKDEFKGIKDTCVALFGQNSDKSNYGFCIPELYRAYQAKDYGNLANLAQKAVYTLAFKDFFDNLKNIKDCVMCTGQGEAGVSAAFTQWGKGLLSVHNLIPTNLLEHLLLRPLENLQNKTGGILNAAFGITHAVSNVPCRGRKLVESINGLVKNPGRAATRNLELVKETLPNAFNYSYEKLIGIAKFFRAASNLCIHFDAQAQANPQAAAGLKLFGYLQEFNDWLETSIQGGEERFATPLDRYHKQAIAVLKAEIAKLEKTIDEFANRDDVEQKVKDQLDRAKEALEKKMSEYTDKLNLDNGKAVGKLLALLNSKLFRQKPGFWQKKRGLWQSHIGKITVTFKRMVELHDHFYPMYQALSELVGMMALAKKIVKSKHDPHNKYCFVNFETGKDRPHFKVVNGWNPTAVVDTKNPKNGFSHIVPSSFEVGGRADGKNQHMLITGGNGKGKSTLMRATLYQIWTAQTLGIAPAESLTMTPFHYIYSLPKDVEDAASGQSTHMSQVNIVFNQLQPIVASFAEQKKFSWVNCDEMFNGTVAASASANATAFLTNLPKECICCVATHHEQTPLIAPRETNGGVVCYKINPSSKKLEPGIMEMLDESTNASIMEEQKVGSKEISQVRRLEQEFALLAKAGRKALETQAQAQSKNPGTPRPVVVAGT